MEIKSIKIEFNGTEYDVSLDEAQKLYQALDKLFGDKTFSYPTLPYTWPKDEPFVTYTSNNS